MHLNANMFADRNVPDHTNSRTAVLRYCACSLYEPILPVVSAIAESRISIGWKVTCGHGAIVICIKKNNDLTLTLCIGAKGWDRNAGLRS